ncbi:MAG TPA: hypothetical protein VE548_16060, partial [Nitrososphaeraceae archaeon]|nr:hypothetical protein [Nitrososphaeraceae archaeon]
MQLLVKIILTKPLYRGFKIRASDIKIHIDPKKIDDTETRVDIPLLLAKDIKVSNGGLINLSYDAVDLGSVYGIY